jgi:hypothetical protein
VDINLIKTDEGDKDLDEAAINMLDKFCTVTNNGLNGCEAYLYQTIHGQVVDLIRDEMSYLPNSGVGAARFSLEDMAALDAKLVRWVEVSNANVKIGIRFLSERLK